MKAYFCSWCHDPIKVKDTFDETKGAAVCNSVCKDAETLFNLWMSDEAINRRSHYKALTKGDG